MCNLGADRASLHASPAMLKADVLHQLDQQRIIALVRIDSAAQLIEIGTQLRAAGLSQLELPLTCPAVPDFMAEARPALEGVSIGIGTVIDLDSARRSIIAGARFISTPALRPAVILLCRRHQVPVICGAHSAEEIAAAIEAGADAIKLYPSRDRFGPTHVRETRAIFPTARLYPVGGVTKENIADFIAGGAQAVFVASGLGFTIDSPGRPRDHREFDLRAEAAALVASIRPTSTIAQ